MSSPKLEMSHTTTNKNNNESLLKEFLCWYLEYLRLQSFRFRSSVRNNNKCQLLLGMEHAASSTSSLEPTEQNGIGLYYHQVSQLQKLAQRTIRTILEDMELQYGLALFQILLLKHLVRSSEKENLLREQCSFMEKMISTLEYCLTLLDSPKGTAPIRMEIAQALDALGRMHRDGLQDFPQSFVYYTRAMETKCIIYGDSATNLDLAASMEILGVLMRDRLDCIPDSIRCFREALHMKECVYGTAPQKAGGTAESKHNHDKKHHRNVAKQLSDLAQTLHSLGLAYDLSGYYEEARTFYEKALLKRQMQLKEEQNRHLATSKTHPLRDPTKTTRQLIATLFNLGCVAEKLVKLEDARAYLEEALQMQYLLHSMYTMSEHTHERLESADGLIRTSYRLASIYERCKEQEGAHKYFNSGLDIHCQTIREESEHRKTESLPGRIRSPASKREYDQLIISVFHGAANASNLLGQYEDSLVAYESLLEILQAARDDTGHSKLVLISTFHNLGLLNDVLGNAKHASKYYRLALERMETEECLKESSTAHSIRMNVLCLPDPLSDEIARPKIPFAVVKSAGGKAKTTYGTVFSFYKDQMERAYNRQNYVDRDAAMAITLRNLANLSSMHARNYVDARNRYEQFVEVVWYGKQGDLCLTSRYFATVQSLHALGCLERKLRHYGSARHYQKEGISMLVKAKKELEQHKLFTPCQAKRIANLRTVMGKEIQVLNGLCVWLSWLKE